MQNIDFYMFHDTIKSGRKILVKFSTPWCQPCKMLNPVLEAVEAKVGIEIYKADIDENPQFADLFNIMTVPTMILFADGIISDVTTGYKTEQEVLDFIKA